MEESDNLKSEILLLKKITTVLIDQIGILKSENDFLKSKLGIKNEFNTNDILLDTIKQSINTEYNFMDGIKNISNTNDENYDSIKSLVNTNDNIKKDIKSILNTIDENKDGINTVLNAVSGIAPHDLKINNNSITHLGNTIRKIFPPRASWSKVKNVAMEMLLINNNGFASSDEMRQITGLSKPGFAKHLPSLKRSGLIYRESHKKYALTELGKSLMNKAFGNADRNLY